MARPAVAVAVAVAVLGAAPAGAQTVRMEPRVLQVGKTQRVTYFLTLPAGRWTVVADVPGFVRGRRAFGTADPLIPYGSPFTPSGTPSGPAGATVTGGGPGTAGLPNVCRRGFDAPADPLTEVTMPAGGGTLSWGFWVSRAQRWSATDYRVAFRVRGPSGRTVTVRPPAPVVRGRLGTRFRFRLRRSGSSFVVSGSTQPPLRRARVSLMTAAARDGASTVPVFPAEFTPARAVRTVRTTAAGRFTMRWRPRSGRHYAAWVGSFTERGRLGDSSCPLRISTEG